MTTNDSSTDKKKNLFDSFAETTETKEAPQQKVSVDKDLEENEPKGADIEENSANQEQQSVASEKKKLFSFQKSEEEINEKESEPEKVKRSAADIKSQAELNAEIYVGTLDGIQAFSCKKILTWKYKKKIGGEQALTEALDLCDELDAQEENGITPDLTRLTLDQRTNIRLARNFMKRIDELPFSEEEFYKMTNPLAKIIAVNPKYEMSPEMMFFLAISQIMIPKIVDTVFD